MFSSLRHLLARWFGTAPQDNAAPEAHEAQHPSPEEVSEPSALQEAAAHNHLAPHDKNLLERARTQWQFGDWDSLAELDQDALQYHPDRAKLALLAAAGRLQTQRTDEARQYIRLAQEWGISKKLLTQILAAGVHNSLGRAAVLNKRPQRALQHFGAAIALGTPGADTRSLIQARTNEQLHQLGLADSKTALFNNQAADKSGPVTEDSPASLLTPATPVTPAAANIEQLAESVKAQSTKLDEQLKKQADELIRVRKFLDSSLKKEVANATKQIEAAMGLQAYFATGELPNVNTERHSWPISPDFALYLIELLETNDYDLIIEFGSGISTVIIAKTLAKMAPKRSGQPPVDFVSFDHLEKYYQQTHAQLAQAGLSEAVQLTLAPLQDWLAPNGKNYPYYACQPTLAAMAKKHAAKDLRLLVIVDGPPAATGPHARYPAGPLVLQHFAGAHIDLLLDDYIREDEKEIAKLWQNEIAAATLTYNVTERQLEKDACLIRVSHNKEKQ